MDFFIDKLKEEYYGEKFSQFMNECGGLISENSKLLTNVNNKDTIQQVTNNFQKIAELLANIELLNLSENYYLLYSTFKDNYQLNSDELNIIELINNTLIEKVKQIRTNNKIEAKVPVVEIYNKLLKFNSNLKLSENFVTNNEWNEKEQYINNLNKEELSNLNEQSIDNEDELKNSNDLSFEDMILLNSFDDDNKDGVSVVNDETNLGGIEEENISENPSLVDELQFPKNINDDSNQSSYNFADNNNENEEYSNTNELTHNNVIQTETIFTDSDFVQETNKLQDSTELHIQNDEILTSKNTQISEENNFYQEQNIQHNNETLKEQQIQSQQQTQTQLNNLTPSTIYYQNISKPAISFDNVNNRFIINERFYISAQDWGTISSNTDYNLVSLHKYNESLREELDNGATDLYIDSNYITHIDNMLSDFEQIGLFKTCSLLIKFRSYLIYMINHYIEYQYDTENIINKVLMAINNLFFSNRTELQYEDYTHIETLIDTIYNEYQNQKILINQEDSSIKATRVIEEIFNKKLFELSNLVLELKNTTTEIDKGLSKFSASNSKNLSKLIINQNEIIEQMSNIINMIDANHSDYEKSFGLVNNNIGVINNKLIKFEANQSNSGLSGLFKKK
jgi:hypothetical protein